ncbi:MAG: FtsQ-type POTRA domain-containing protein [Deltaproteobacteria bacterium]|nr:FtsQ-type POTRA domain-containing protein [Deltaproteobacteria bacterium]
MQIARLAKRLSQHRRKVAAPGNRRRHTTGTSRGRAAASPRSEPVREGSTGLRKARQDDPPPPGRGWARRGLKLGLRLGIAGTLAWALLVGVREGYAYATTSPRFEVRGLLYEPTPHVSDTRLRELMALPPGTNILSLDLDAIAARIADEPWVARASVVRVLPDSLEVSVQEHEPRAVLLLAGRLLLLDDSGVPFKTLESGERGRLPVLTGFDDVVTQGGPETWRQPVTRGLALLEAYQAKRRPRLSEIHIGSTGELTLYTAEMGSQLRLGRGEHEPALARYDALRAALGEEAEKLAVVHLDGSRAPGRPDRIVASFFPAKQAPTLVAEAQARAEQRAADAVARAEQQAQAKASKKKKSKLDKSKGVNAKGSLPKYD